jgi:hypothetical protein
MPIEGEFGELDFRLIGQWRKRTEKKFMVSIVRATENASKTIERRAT